MVSSVRLRHHLDAQFRSDSRVFRQPRVIQVNRDAATMMDDEASVSGMGNVTEPPCSSDFESNVNQSTHFRSRTFSDGFIRNTSLELLLGVDCEACLALAAQQHCINEPNTEQDFDLCYDRLRTSNIDTSQKNVKGRNFDINDELMPRNPPLVKYSTLDNRSRCRSLTAWHRRWCCVAILVLVAGTACVAGPLALRAPPGAPLHEDSSASQKDYYTTPHLLMDITIYRGI
ncbi:unnamed protein product [Danaus chrysippus]|uniref:(African queen) hypothetical protein n=1 Tax=Danaus chrysippus TaxID=151541 RepID=A0A8J2VSZ5_9NEOP|nr:unnamed protein product [Danaus chrysippus]